jgi:hypothetical protein
MHAILPKSSNELVSWLILSATNVTVTATITATDKGTFR